MVNFSKKYSEIRVNGWCVSGCCPVVLGRVKLFDESYTEGGILCVRRGERLDAQMLSLCPPIAVVVFGEVNEDKIRTLSSLGVPCLVVDTSEIRCEDCKNRVALVDSERGIFLIDPTIETLGAYSLKSKRAIYSLSCPIGRALDNLNGVEKSEAEHYLVRGSALGADVFEAAVGLWERLCPESLILDIDAPSEAEGAEREFCELCESVYRAALYGNFAISISGFDTEEELSRALRLLHKSFCALEAEGREFNSYLPRGITLSSPLWLMRPSPVANPDFLIFDLDKLLPSLFSLSVDDVIKKEKALKKELFAVLERYFLHFAPRCDVYLKAERLFGTTLLHDMVRVFGVKMVFRGNRQ